MTNAEYECSCIGAANAPCRTEGERKLEAKDNAIAVLEATLALMQEERREIINRYNLNKCSHAWSEFAMLGLPVTLRCVKCGVVK